MSVNAPRDDLLRQVDDGWQGFSAAVSAVTAERLGDPTDAGWTGKAMLAHVAAWHDATAYRLHRFSATGRAQPKVEEDDDRFNARVADETADRPTDEVLDALFDSFRRFRSALASLPRDLEHREWVEGVVAANSFDHYAEHLAELEALARG